MPLTTQQIQQLLSEARVAGLDDDEITALEWALLDRAAQLDGANRLDIALQLGDDNEIAAAETFMGEMQGIRSDAIKRGANELSTISDDEWESLINA
jgi:hypothetical protein